MHSDAEKIEALIGGNTEKLEMIASHDLDFPAFSHSENGRSWLEIAIAEGAPESIQWLIERGSTLKYGSWREQGCFPPLYAALQRQLNDRHVVLRMLISAGADVNERGPNGYSPAHVAACDNDLESLKILAAAGADLNMRTDVDEFATPLEEALSLYGENEATAWLLNNPQPSHRTA